MKVLLSQGAMFYRCSACGLLLRQGDFLVDDMGDVCLQIQPCPSCMRVVPPQKPDLPTAKELVQDLISDIRASLAKAETRD